MTTKGYTVAFLFVPIVALASWYVWHRDPPPFSVVIIQAQQGPLLSAVTATGAIEARRTVDIKYDTESPVTRLYVKEGDEVVANQPVATMDLSLLEPGLVQARETLQKDQASLLLAQASLHRAQALFDAQVLAQVDLDTARANDGALLHQTEADKGAVNQAEEQIRRATLRSPIKGVVIALNVHEGEMLGSATAVAGLGPEAAISKPTNTLMTVAEGGNLELGANVNATDMGSVLVGQNVKFTIDAFEPKIFSGVVRSVALQPTVTNNVTTYRVIVSIPRPDHRFRIGMPASAMLIHTLTKDAVLIPPTALLRENGVSSVFVMRRRVEDPIELSAAEIIGERKSPDKRLPQRVSVQLIGETSSAVAVTGEINVGDWVALNPTSLVTSTNSINLIETTFKPNPDPSDLQFERTSGPTDQATSTIPGPPPKGFLQQLFAR
jgi:HlyD family secretion protein